MNKLTWRQRLALWLVPEYVRLRDLCIDLNAQVNTLRSTGGIDPDELKGYAEMRIQHTAMMERERELGVWIRDRFKVDIEQGKHAGKSLVEVLQMHLGEK